MLRKVLKYELKSTGRMLLPAFGFSLLLSAFFRFMMFISPYLWEPAGVFITSIASSLGILLLIAVILFTFIFVLIRFAQGVAFDEAYLTFTLPVKVDSHIGGRLISGCIYTLLGTITAILCGIIFIPNFISQFASALDPITESTSISLSDFPIDIWISGIGLIVFLIITTIIFNILMIYASLGIGSRLTRSKILGGIIGYLILNSIESILSVLLMMPLMFIFGSTNNEIGEYMTVLMTDDIFETLRNLLGMFWIVIGASTLINLLFASVHYFLTRYFYGKKLNLE